MTTYSVKCAWCQHEMLIEQPEPMDDPGELPAFCGNDCSRRFGKRMMQKAVDSGIAMMVDLPCGCFALVYSVEGPGSTMPWPLCERARGKPAYFEHSQEVHEQAVTIARKKLEGNDSQ